MDYFPLAKLYQICIGGSQLQKGRMVAWAETINFILQRIISYRAKTELAVFLILINIKNSIWYNEKY